MGHEQYVVELKQVRMNRRLVFVYIERRCGDQVLPERPRKRRLVDDGPSSGVDEIRGALHSRQRSLVDEMPSFGCERHVQRHHIGRIQQAIERQALRAVALGVAT